METLAWLWKVDTNTVKGNKDVILKDLLTATENLLPDRCDICEEVYVVGRGEIPSIRCSGCHQGFHEPCVVTTGLVDVLPKLPGKMTWLCHHCKDNFELVTTLGNRGKPTIRSTKRLPPTTPPTTPPSNPLTPPTPVISADEGGSDPATVIAADDGGSAGDVQEVHDVSSEPPPVSETSDPDTGVTKEKEVCQLYLKGECPYGISGKTNGDCLSSHPRRCAVYMRWGDKVAKGCKDESCSKLHPEMCPKSLDLKCVDKSCPHKLHTKKCIRSRRRPAPACNTTTTTTTTCWPECS